MTNSKRLNVTVTAYEGDVEFPEAYHYPEFVSAQLAERFGAKVETDVGTRNQVFAHGFEDDAAVAEDAMDLIKGGLWDDFCSHGYKEFSA
jgi:hypothetical protein